jgi:hypothetical protein
MSRIVRLLVPTVALAGLLAVVPRAEAADKVSVTAYTGANYAVLYKESVNVCDRESDAYGVVAQVTFPSFPGLVIDVPNMNGSGTCRSWNFGAGTRTGMVRICEYQRRHGASNCGTWKSRVTIA